MCCRVMAHVSSELTAPKQRRPNEGVLFVNVELSPMAHPTFEQGRYAICELYCILSLQNSILLLIIILCFFEFVFM